jgi:ribonuclease HII
VLVYAGIDEAGYGPMLGPLCVAMTAFALDRDAPPTGSPDLWTLLASSVCRRRRDPRRRIAVDDSKNLKGSKGSATHPLLHLERGVLAFKTVAGSCPPHDDGFLDLVMDVLPDAAWYRSRTDLPVAQSDAQRRIDASRLRRALAEAGAGPPLMRCEAIDAGSFNEQVHRMGSKAGVNLAAVMRLVDTVWRTWPDHHPRVVIDRQGGRRHYREDLQLAYPDARIRILAETDAFSRYRLAREDAEMTISFVRDGDQRHLPVALASMLAKYVRELFMIRLNRFFQGELPRLAPTAGYVEDARRYLVDIEPVVQRLQVPRHQLVRQV